MIKAALLKKGFRCDERDHHYYIYHDLTGKRTAKKTKMSHGSSYKTIGDELLGKMANQVGLTKKDFLRLVDCTVDQSGYEGLAFPI